jgi:hypothetical protein
MPFLLNAYLWRCMSLQLTKHMLSILVLENEFITVTYVQEISSHFFLITVSDYPPNTSYLLSYCHLFLFYNLPLVVTYSTDFVSSLMTIYKQCTIFVFTFFWDVYKIQLFKPVQLHAITYVFSPKSVFVNGGSMDLSMCNIINKIDMPNIQQKVRYKQNGCFTTGLHSIREWLGEKF